MLQAFSGQGRASSGASHKKSATAHIGGGPDQIANALKAKHRIVDEERNRVNSMIRISRAGRDERTHRPGYRYAFLENLPVLGFLVIEQRVHVDRFVELAHVGVN